MRNFINALFRPRAVVEGAKDFTTTAVQNAVEQNKKASARLETTVRELMAENNKLRLGAKDRGKKSN
jgi:hypothetical protein